MGFVHRSHVAARTEHNVARAIVVNNLLNYLASIFQTLGPWLVGVGLSCAVHWFDRHRQIALVKLVVSNVLLETWRPCLVFICLGWVKLVLGAWLTIIGLHVDQFLNVATRFVGGSLALGSNLGRNAHSLLVFCHWTAVALDSYQPLVVSWLCLWLQPDWLLADPFKFLLLYSLVQISGDGVILIVFRVIVPKVDGFPLDIYVIKGQHYCFATAIAFCVLLSVTYGV